MFIPKAFSFTTDYFLTPVRFPATRLQVFQIVTRPENSQTSIRKPEELSYECSDNVSSKDNHTSHQILKSIFIGIPEDRHNRASSTTADLQNPDRAASSGQKLRKLLHQIPALLSQRGRHNSVSVIQRFSSHYEEEKTLQSNGNESVQPLSISRTAD